MQVELPHGGGAADLGGQTSNEGLGGEKGTCNQDQQQNGKGGGTPNQLWRNTPSRTRLATGAPQLTAADVTLTRNPPTEGDSLPFFAILTIKGRILTRTDTPLSKKPHMPSEPRVKT